MSSDHAHPTILNVGTQPIHPGETLQKNYLEPLDLSASALASHLLVPASRIQGIVSGRKGITVDTALRLARYFGGDAQAWLNLQMHYDLRCAQTNAKKLATIESIQPYAVFDMSAGAYRFCW